MTAKFIIGVIQFVGAFICASIFAAYIGIFSAIVTITYRWVLS